MTDPRRIDKARVLDALRARLAENLDELLAAQRTVQHGAVHEENRQEHAKDTRAIEQTYLARGLAERVEDLTDAVRRMAALSIETYGDDDAVGLTALVVLEDEDGDEDVYFVAPFGGGERLDIDGLRVQVLTPQAPLGRAIVGRRTGDEVRLQLPGGTRLASVVAVR